MDIQTSNSDKKELLGKILFGISILFLLYMVFTPLNQYLIHTDEYFTVALIRLPLLDGISLTSADVHPPLYYLIVKLILNALSLLNIKYNLIVVLKLISIIPFFIILTICGFRFRKEYDWFVIGLFCFVLAILSEFFIYFIIARMYSWGLLFLFLGFISFREILNKSDIKSWAFLTLFAVLGAYTHYFVALSFGVLYLLLLIYYLCQYFMKNDSSDFDSISFNEKTSLGDFSFKSEFFKLLSSIILAIVLYIPWINVLFSQIFYVQKYFWVQPLGINNVLSFLVYFIWPNFSIRNLDGLGILSFIALAFFIFLLIDYLRHSNENSIQKTYDGFKNSSSSFWKDVKDYGFNEKYFILSGFLLFFLTILIAIILSIVYKPIIIKRYLIPSSAILWFAIIILIDKIDEKKLLAISLVLILIFSVSGLFAIMDTTNDLYDQGYEDAKFFNEINDKENIVISDSGTLLVYGSYIDKASQYSADDSYCGVNLTKLESINLKIISGNDTSSIIENEKDKDVYIFTYIDPEDIKEEDGKIYFPISDGDKINYIEVKSKQAIANNEYYRFYEVV